MSELAGYIKTGAIAKIVMDDGKVNVMSAAMLGALLGAFDRGFHHGGRSYLLRADGGDDFARGRRNRLGHC